MTPDTTDFNSLSKKQLVELVITKYNDCFRLEEENKSLKGVIDRLHKEIEEQDKEYAKLLIDYWWVMWERDGKQMVIEKIEEENKKLKSDIMDMDKALMQYINAVSELQEEISNLKEELSKIKEKYWDIGY